jgi:hypothetical protein
MAGRRVAGLIFTMMLIAGGGFDNFDPEFMMVTRVI